MYNSYENVMIANFFLKLEISNIMKPKYLKLVIVLYKLCSS